MSLPTAFCACGNVICPSRASCLRFLTDDEWKEPRREWQVNGIFDPQGEDKCPRFIQREEKA